MSKIKWLHMSDWHHRPLDASPDRKVVLEKLHEDISHRAQIDREFENIDLLFFSGDIAFSGQKNEFDEARDYVLTPIKKMLGNDVRMIFCPGNHDIDRTLIGQIPKEWSQIAGGLDGYSEDLEALILNKNRASELRAPFQNYIDFCGHFGQKYNDGELCYSECFTIQKKSIGVASINTAWHSARYSLNHGHDDLNISKIWDYGALKVTEAQIRDAIRNTKEADLKILVMHHPLNWLAEDDQIRINALIKMHFDVVLNGHEHKPDMAVLSGGAGNVLHVPAGASYNRRIAHDPRYTNSYNYCCVETIDFSGTIHHRKWSEDNDCWTEDERYWERGKSSFLINTSNKDRFAARRSLMFDVEKQFAVPLAKRSATDAKVEISHEPVQIDDHNLLDMRVHYRFSYEPGQSENFEIVSTPSDAVRAIDSQSIRSQAYEFEGALPEPHICDFENPDVRDKFRCVIPIGEDASTVSFRYRCLEAQNDVFIWRLKRFTGDVELTIYEASGYDYRYVPLGGFPALEPEPGLKRGVRHLVSKDRIHLPGQGYLIQWRPCVTCS